MKILCLFLKLITITMQVDPRPSVDPNFFSMKNRILEDLLVRESFRDVQFITGKVAASEKIVADEIIGTVSRMVPITSLSNEATPTEEFAPFPVTSSTLICYICALKNSTDLTEIEHLSILTAYAGSKSRVLTIAFTKYARGENFRSALEYLWTKRILNLTIMELPVVVGSIVLHWYNPFTKNYTSKRYDDDESIVDWFPDKLGNLHGFRLTMDVLNRPGQSVVRRNSQGYPVKFKGPDKRVLMTLYHALNFTPVFCSRPDEVWSLEVENGTIKGQLARIQSGEVELMLTTLPVMAKVYPLLGSSYPFDFEKWCVLLPVTYRLSRLDLRNFRNVLLCVFFVTAFWVLSVAIKFRSKIWQPLYVFGALISVSVSPRIDRSVERLVFLSVLLISCFYSSSLYIDLALARLQQRTEIVYKNFEELHRSGLTPVLHREVYDLVLDTDDEWIRRLAGRAIKTSLISACAYDLLRHRNVSCFMARNTARDAVLSTMTSIMPEMRLNENLCYWTPPIGYTFHKRSPFTERFSDILLRMEESGIRSRWYLDYFYEITPKNITKVYGESVEDVTALNLWLIIAIIVTGYTVSTVILVGELILYRLSERLGRK